MFSVKVQSILKNPHHSIVKNNWSTMNYFLKEFQEDLVC